ncbi:hypothetical protein HXX76_007159 [Chlamydomonas incerta]|uniref:Uncharacterized protein n=1 Tax=Chlamydomonas incerta TaxID=51695 RepID=A0A835VZJ7_CHLIN|nr:hypothetical protein HXX76_007159 [Chlamydomonas incerta]|eukprot:KAG2435072.1 hypothetical protein HXX76_007159 [Chlamydomonas incerta]
MDNRPFPELRKIVREANDSRIWVHAEWINYKYAPKEGGTWAPNYHNKLYNLTDMAVRACPENTRWVVITNGDNLYDPRFVETIYSAPPDVDAVAVDFYSRYQRPTAEPCERFEEGEGVPPCKENGMRFCQTDLAANAYKLQRLLVEDRRFGLVDPGGTHGANDGIMAQLLKTAGWKIHYVHGHCLVNHAPSPQQCALNGGVWDDSVMAAASSFGGSCAETFGRVCAARIDLQRLPANLPPHPWDAWVPIFESTPDDINAHVPAPAGTAMGEEDGDEGYQQQWHHEVEDGSSLNDRTEL